MTDLRQTRSRARAVVLAASLALPCLLPACCSNPKNGSQDAPVIPSYPPPTYAEILAAHNARTAKLDILTVLADIILKGRDVKGTDQAEGLVSFIRPAKVALRVTKVGQTLFRLGSDGEMYWWIDLAGDEPIALTGRFESATPQRIARLGIPVHPLDLPELLGVVPLPASPEGSVAWSKDGRGILVTLPSRWNGTKSLLLDPKTLLPGSIELRDAQGRVVMSSNLSKYEIVAVRGDALTRPQLAMRCEVQVPEPPTQLTLIMHDPQNPGIDRIQKTQFNFQSLAKGIPNLREVSLDAEPSVPPPASSSAPPHTPERSP